MKRVRPYIPIVALLLMLSSGISSCRRDTAVRDALARAEALMETDPPRRSRNLGQYSLTQPSPKGKGFRFLWSPLLQEG